MGPSLRKSFNEDMRIVDIATLDATSNATATNLTTLSVVNAIIVGFIVKIIVDSGASVSAILQGSTDGGTTWVALRAVTYTAGTQTIQLEVISPGIYSKLRVRIVKTGLSQIIAGHALVCETGLRPASGFKGCVPQYPTDQVIPVDGVTSPAYATTTPSSAVV